MRSIELWWSNGFDLQLQNNPILNALVDDFANYIKGELEFNGLGDIGYLNAKYLFGRDVACDRPPVEILGIDYPRDKAGTCSHIHLIDRTVQTGNVSGQKFTYSELTSKRHLRDYQERWTSDCFLIYYQHSLKENAYAILDFWPNGHSRFSHAERLKLLDMIEIYEDNDAAKRVI
ncbi:type II toxin-antitoxin system YafO family toxin [Microbulbifer sp. DLAB2-AF]|jgi:hypothetical protein|uniref:type II toxin-antitoxin system YafO family toxin n=1 Tax=Microbulbifer sp. DLAB2-AF TaxID=3243395 RepID=UPI00403A1098